MFRKFGSTLKIVKRISDLLLYLEGIYLCYNYIQFTEYLKEQSFLLTSRNEQFEKQQSRPQRKAVSVEQSVQWRKLQFSQPRSQRIQKVRVWRENNHKYFSGLKIFFTSVSSSLLGNWIPEPQIPHRSVKSVCCSHCFESDTRQNED